MFLQLPVGRADGRDVQRHARLFRRTSALFQVARRTGGGDVFPGRPATLRARNDMVERQVAARAAILAGEPVAQEQVEPGEGGKLRRLHELLQRDHRRQLHRHRRAAYFAFVMRDDVDAVEEHRLDRGLPRPDRQRIIGKRRIVRVQHERGASLGMTHQIGMKHGSSHPYGVR